MHYERKEKNETKLTQSVETLLKAALRRGWFVGFQEAGKLPDSGGMAHLAEGFGFDLADALAGDFELPAHFLQRAGITVTQPKAQFQHLPFPFRQAAQDIAQFVLE